MGTTRGANLETSPSFSRTSLSDSDALQNKALYPFSNPIPKQSNFRAANGEEEKTTLPEAPSRVTEFPCVATKLIRFLTEEY